MIIPISLHAKQVPPPQERNSYWQRAFGPNSYTLTVHCKEQKSYEIEGVEGPSRISLIAEHVLSFIRDFFSILYKNAKTKSATAPIIAEVFDNKGNQKKMTIYTKSLIERMLQPKKSIPVSKQNPTVLIQANMIQTEDDIKQALVGFILGTPHKNEIKIQGKIQQTRDDNKKNPVDSPEEKQSCNPKGLNESCILKDLNELD